MRLLLFSFCDAMHGNGCWVANAYANVHWISSYLSSNWPQSIHSLGCTQFVVRVFWRTLERVFLTAAEFTQSNLYNAIRAPRLQLQVRWHSGALAPRFCDNGRCPIFSPRLLDDVVNEQQMTKQFMRCKNKLADKTLYVAATGEIVNTWDNEIP